MLLRLVYYWKQGGVLYIQRIKKIFFCFLLPFNECYENSNKMLIKFNINIPLCESIEALVNQQEQKRICIEILIMSGRGFP